MAHIAVDIDSTLYDFETPCRNEFMRLAYLKQDKSLFRGAYTPWVEWRSPADACGLEAWLEIIERVHDDDMLLEMEPFPDAALILNQLQGFGHDLFYISNRATERQSSTQAWLDDNGFPKGELVCTSEDKMGYLTHCQYIIDDRPSTLIRFTFDREWNNLHLDESRVGFGLMYEYNRALTDLDPHIFLAPTWVGLRYYFDRCGLYNAKVLVNG